MMVFHAILQQTNSSLRRLIIQPILSRIFLTKPSIKFLTGFAKYSRSSNPSYNLVLDDHLEIRKIEEARALFNDIQSPDVYSCTKMISGYIESRTLNDALQLFDKMRVKDIVAWNLMVKGCLQCGEMEMSLKLFDEMPERNVKSWTILIDGLLKVGRVEEAEMFFWKMPMRDIAAWNAMIHGYFENGRVDHAMRLFAVMPSRNVITWTSVISGLDKQGRNDEARLIFAEMVGFGVLPTSSCFASVITACANVLDISLGIQSHGLIVKLGCLFDAYVCASLIIFYANCKKMNDSCKVFNEKLHINVVVWTSLLTGYVTNSNHEEALNVFGAMFRNGIIPNQSSFTSALNSCSEMEGVDQGREIHSAAIKLGLDTDAFVGNSFVVLYSKCGSIVDGIVIFKEISKKNIVSWNSVIVGCAQHGHCNWALTFFGQMLRAGANPDDITFTGLLSACSNSGMLKKGRRFFEYLQQDKTMNVKLEHYSCMLDILCRCGELEEAENLIRNMPMRANLSMLLSLLNGCRQHCNLDLAERVAKIILRLDPHCSSAHVVLSNMYAVVGRWHDVAKIRVQMKKSGTVKNQGCSWVT